MKYNYFITTDATCDYDNCLNEREFDIIPMDYTIDNKSFTVNKRSSSQNRRFYNYLRDGKLANTSQISPNQAIEYWTPLLKNGYDIFHLCFSSALSGTYQSMLLAKSELREKFPDRKIIIIDTLLTTVGLSMACNVAIKKRQEGLSIEENEEFIRDYITHVNLYFTVDNMFHLYRGGRISKTSAVAATVMRIKPFLYMTEIGTLENIEKVMSRKLVLKRMTEKFKVKTANCKQTECWIAHCDVEADAKALAEKLKKVYGVKNVHICVLNPIIGTHLGPGAMIIGFYGENKSK